MKNQLYQAIYARDWDNDKKHLRAMQVSLQKQFDAMKLAEQRRRQPRSKSNFQPLPLDTQQAIIDKIKASPAWDEMGRLEARIIREMWNRERWLDALAPRIELETVQRMHRLKTSSSRAYSAQDYGAMSYAKGVLEPLLDALERHGFEAYIRKTNVQKEVGILGMHNCDWELWANCEPWVFDAVRRCLSLSDTIASWLQRHLIPFVYDHSLPYWTVGIES